MTTPTTTPFPTPTEQAAADLGEAGRRRRAHALNLLERAVVSLVPIEGETGVHMPRLRAAVALRSCLEEAVREYALACRSAGYPWHALAGPLGLVGAAAADPVETRQAKAFLWCALLRADPPEPLSPLQEQPFVTWVCHACGGDVIDRGPGEREQGHRPGCVRHDAEREVSGG